MKKNKLLNIIFALQIISTVSAFLIGFFCGKTNNTKEGTPLALFCLDFYLGNFIENWLTIFMHNYAVAFVLYLLNCLTFGILGILNLLIIFFIIGFSSFFSTGIVYWLFIIFESAGFLYSVFSSTNLRFEIKQKGFKSCRKNISFDLLNIILILSVASFLEVLAIK